jgi:hypothetical protein
MLPIPSCSRLEVAPGCSRLETAPGFMLLQAWGCSRLLQARSCSRLLQAWGCFRLLQARSCSLLKLILDYKIIIKITNSFELYFFILLLLILVKLRNNMQNIISLVLTPTQVGGVRGGGFENNPVNVYDDVS